MPDSIFVQIPGGGKLTKTLEVMLEPGDLDIKSFTAKNMPQIKKMLKNVTLRVYNESHEMIARGRYSNAYADDGKIRAVYRITEANHAT